MAFSIRTWVTTAIVSALLVSVTIFFLGVLWLLPENFSWRSRVILAKIEGNLPEIPVPALANWLLPASQVKLRHLAKDPDVRAGIRNPNLGEAVARIGSLVYSRSCAQCHGSNARGQSAPNLLKFVQSKSDWDFLSLVKWGRPSTAMRAQPISDLQAWQVHSFLTKLGKDGDSIRVPPVDLSGTAILNARETTDQWLTYGGNYAGHRHSYLRQINRQTVAKLSLAWAAQAGSSGSTISSTPLVVGHMMFLSESPAGVTAFHAKTGEQLWHFERPLAKNIALCCGDANRGVAVLGDKVYIATLDAYLLALDASTGKKVWEVKVADYSANYSITGAPLVLKDSVLIGVSGGNLGAMGFIAAFAPEDGNLIWRFDTIAKPGEPGHETWPGDSWEIGGVSPWTTGSYDSELDLVYWGTGNPTPLFDKRERAGDNLYSNSVVALDAATGKLRWYFQFTPGDDHDWDAVEHPVLVDVTDQSVKQRLLLTANRNGFFYVLDRQSGKFILGKPFVKQNWTSGLSPEGRPITRPSASPSQTGSLVWPSLSGATNWWPPSFDPVRGFFFVPALESASVFYRDSGIFTGIEPNYESGNAHDPLDGKVTAAVKAIDSITGEVRWEAILAEGGSEVVPKRISGLLSTAGGLVFAGYRDEFFAFDSDSGKRLQQIRLSGVIRAAPISYAIDGVQYVTVSAGDTVFTFSLVPDKLDTESVRSPQGITSEAG